MKVPGSDDSSKAGEAVRISLQGQNKRAPAQGVRNERASTPIKEDRVDLNLGRMLQQELDPQAVEGSRKAKVEELKKLIASGQYSVPSERIAEAFAQEISLDVMTLGRKVKSESEDE